MPEPFILRALAAGIGVALIAGAMGCFVIWRRMAYFGDSLAHSTLLGIALGLAAGLNVNLAILTVCFLFALLLLWLQYQQRETLGTDTLLGILAHAGLSIGMIVVSILPMRFDLRAYLFGDILTVTLHELYWIYGGGIVVLSMLILHWSSLVLISIHKDLAMAESVPVLRSQILFMFLMALVVALSMRVVGILLITSMLIIAPATARQLTHSPETMAILASVLAAFAVIIGILASIRFDIPSGPSIVASLFVFFVLISTFANLKFQRF